MMYANDVTLEDNVLSDNSVGIYLMYGRKFTLRGNKLLRNRGPSGYGLGLKEVDVYTVERNVFSMVGRCRFSRGSGLAPGE